ncbi:MAG: hypothetical protein Q3965_05095 [Rothia sp. (in: high G+C Gram-positive bacteria)]|nr:hypothetical protein [Rothia sp. (in: high G+C Gram-positive bacteria)]
MKKTENTWYNQDKSLRSAGDLIAGGGTAGAFMTLLYVIIGVVVWGLIGYGLDHLLKTSWIVWAGALVGAFGGIYLVFLHMRQSHHK